MEFHQLLSSASAKDAVTGSALELQRLLSQVAPSSIYAADLDEAVSWAIGPLPRYRYRQSPRSDQDVLIYHASIGDPRCVEFLLERDERLFLYYHNMTPAKYFRPYDPEVADQLATGRAELVRLRDRTEVAFAVSEYNAAELRALGYTTVKVVPPFVDVGRLQRAEPDRALLSQIDERQPGALHVYLGQLFPHKRPDLLLQAYHVLVTYVDVDAQLVMLGPERLASYAQSLGRYARQLNLLRLWRPGSVSDEQLAAFLTRATSFVTMSEHEGFCFPVIEAMALGVPVIARACSAIPETAGGAALLLPPDAGPELAAEAMAEVSENTALRRDLIERGRCRAEDFSIHTARTAFLEALTEVV